MQRILAIGMLTLFSYCFPYYPGSPDRNLSVMQTAEITHNKHLFNRFNHRFEEPIAPAGEINPLYHLLGMDGSANIYFDIALGLANLAEITLARERLHRTYALEGKLQVWNHRVDKKPLSLAVTGNVQFRTDRQIETEKRPSFGGSVILDRHLFQDRLNLLFNGFAQSHTNIAQLGFKPDHSVAAGLGALYRIDRASLFGEWIYPISIGDAGYRRTYPGRADNGIPLQAYGFNYRIYYHSFSLLVSNYTSMLAGNFIAGAASPSAERVNEWRLGFNITRTFKMAH